MSFEFDVSNPLFFIGLIAITVLIWITPHIEYKSKAYYEQSLTEKKISYPPSYIFPIIWTILNVLLIAGYVIYWWTEIGYLGVDIVARRWYIGILLVFFAVIVLRWMWTVLFWYVPMAKKRHVKYTLYMTVIIMAIMILLSIFIICAMCYRLSVNLNYITVFSILAMVLFTLWLIIAAYYNVRICMNYKPQSMTVT